MAKSKGKVVACVLALAIAGGAVCAAGIGSAVDGKPFQNGNIPTWFNGWGHGVQTMPLEANGGAVITEGETHGMRLMSEIVPEEEYATYGIDAQRAESVFNLSVTYIPENTTYKETDYFVEWAPNGNSSWEGYGNPITDYVTVTQPYPGSTNATLTVKQSFSSQIIVTAQSKRDINIKATTTVDYVGAIGGYIINDEGTQEKMDGNLQSDADIMATTSENELRFRYSEIVKGTIAPDLKDCLTITFSLDDVVNYKALMADKGFTVNSTPSLTFTPNQLGQDTPLFSIEDIIVESIKGTDLSSTTEKNKFWGAVSEIFLNGQKPEQKENNQFCSYTVTAHRVYNGKDYGDVTLKSGCLSLKNWAGFEIPATGMTTNTPNIVTG